MTTDAVLQAEPVLADLAEQFAQWRQTRQGHEPIPPRLWSQAVALTGYCQLVELQTQLTRDERWLRGLSRLLDARHRLPGDEGLRTDRPGVGGGQEMPTEAKPMVDGSVGRQEPLSLPSGFKPAPLPLLLAGRLMGEFGPVI